MSFEWQAARARARAAASVRASKLKASKRFDDGVDDVPFILGLAP